MHQLEQAMRERIAAGLKRRSLTSCSRWACACRVMAKPFPGPWTFKWHPWLREMHDSEAEFNVGQKAAQVGYTETVLNITFFNIDVKGVDTLYVLPAKTPDASDFSAARFDPALELSPHLSQLFSDVKNIGHKRAGTTNLYIRGSKSRSGLKSIPVGLILLDEVDEMDQDNIPLATERAAGQLEKMIWAVSTPTIDNTGINKMYQISSQEHFFFKCPCCSKMTELIFPQCLEITAENITDESVVNSFLKCKECDGRLHHENKWEWLADGKWVAGRNCPDMRGFHVNQMYSSTISPTELAKAYLRSLRDPSDEQEFYNSKLGLPHVVSGAQVTDADIDRAIGNHRNGKTPRGNLVTMGADVGKWIHYEICHWKLDPRVAPMDLNVGAFKKVVTYGKCQQFEDLDQLMISHGVHFAVVDAHPEKRSALQFANRFYGHVLLCYYGQGVNGKDMHLSKDEPTVTVDRTSWLDLSLSRFRLKDMIQIPLDINQEYRQHIKALVRLYRKDKDGNPVGRYENGFNDDHYAHADNYAEIALAHAVAIDQPQSIRSPV